MMTTAAGGLPEIECITDGVRAAVLLQHPLRPEILARARDPISATALAAGLSLSRQRVNYHVRQLVKAGYLRPAGRRMRRNLVERQYQATAHSYVLSPGLLGRLAANGSDAEDANSSSGLLGLISVVQQELVALKQAESAAGVRVRTVALHSELRFESAAERVAFGEGLKQAVADLVARHTTASADATTTKARPHRMLLGWYPKPQQTE